MDAPTINQAVQKYLGSVKLARSPNTAHTYASAMNVLLAVLKENGINPNAASASELSEDAIVWMAIALKDFSPATEQLYLASTTGFFKFLAAERLSEINLPRLDLLRIQRARRSGQRLPQFPRVDIERILAFVTDLTMLLSDNDDERLRAMRDRAFLINPSRYRITSSRSLQPPARRHRLE